jgi:integrase
VKNWTVKEYEAAKPGRHRVSENLYLFVGPNGAKRWIFRFSSPRTKRVSEMGLGSADVVTLAEARTKVHDARRLVAQGTDPIEQKRAARAASITFADVAGEFLDIQTRRFRNPGSVRNVRLLLMTHAAALGAQPIANIGTSHIDAALRPAWLTSPEQARRAVAAVLRVLKYAKAKGLTAASTADMRKDLSHLQPHVNGAKRHFKALDYRGVPALVRELRAHQAEGDALSPAVIEFLLLTASRENEVCGMQWREIDWQERVWTLPLERYKVGHKRQPDNPHRVPLCDRAMELLLKQRGPNGFGIEPDPRGFVWPGRSGYEPVTGKSAYKYLTQTMGAEATIHGLRATFRTWAGNETNFDRVTAELALAHAAGDAVELAYNRGDALAKRRALMEAWAAYCEGDEAS